MKAFRALSFCYAVEDQQLCAAGQFPDRFLLAEAEPLDSPIEGAQNEYSQRNDLDIGADFPGTASVEKQSIPVFGISTPQRSMPLLQTLGKLAVDSDIRRRKIAGFKQRGKMGLDSKTYPAPVRNIAGFFQGSFDRFKDSVQPLVENFVEDRFLGIEMVINAPRLGLGHAGDLP